MHVSMYTRTGYANDANSYKGIFIVECTKFSYFLELFGGTDRKFAGNVRFHLQAN